MARIVANKCCRLPTYRPKIPHVDPQSCCSWPALLPISAVGWQPTAPRYLVLTPIPLFTPRRHDTQETDRSSGQAVGPCPGPRQISRLQASHGRRSDRLGRGHLAAKNGGRTGRRTGFFSTYLVIVMACFPTPPDSNIVFNNLPPNSFCLTLVFAGLWWWDRKITNLANKIGKLSPDAPEENKLYMQARLARLRALRLAFGFLFQTSLRLNAAYNVAARMLKCRFLCAYMCIDIYIYIYLFIYTYIYIYIPCVYICTCRC